MLRNKISILVFALVSLCLFVFYANAQQTKPSLDNEINTNLPDNSAGAITPQVLRNTLADMVASWQQYMSVNAQGGISYTIQNSDYGKLLLFNSSSNVAVALPSGATLNPFNFYAKANSSGTVTITPASGTIGGQTSLVLVGGQSAQVASDGANWQVIILVGATGSNLVVGSSTVSGGANLSCLGTSSGILANVSCQTVFNVQNYGWLPNGTPVSSTIIANILNAACPNGVGAGGTVYFPPGTPIATASIVSGTYNSGTGAVSLTLSQSIGAATGTLIFVSGAQGTGSFAAINRSVAAVAGTGGTTLNYTIPTGLTLTITAGGTAGVYGAYRYDAGPITLPNDGGIATSSGIPPAQCSLRFQGASGGQVWPAPLNNGTYTLGIQGASVLDLRYQSPTTELNQSLTYGAGFIGTISGSTLTVVSVSSGSIAAGQRLVVVGQQLQAASGDGTVIASGSGSTWTLSQSLAGVTAGPTFMYTVSQGIGSRGSGYSGHDTITLAASGGTQVSPAVIEVTKLDGSGGVSEFNVITPGVFSSNPTSFTQASTSGIGTGFTLTSPSFRGVHGKIETSGQANFELDHLFIMDGGSSNPTAFVQDSNTVLKVHDNTFLGTYNAAQDGIVLGGTCAAACSAPLNTSTPNGPFSPSWGTAIRDNAFIAINRALLNRPFSPTIFEGNSTFQPAGPWSYECNATGASNFFADVFNAGSVVVNNEFSLGFSLSVPMPYVVDLNGCATGYFGGNVTYGTNGQTIALFHVWNSAYGNTIQQNVQAGTVGAVGTGSNQNGPQLVAGDYTDVLNTRIITGGEGAYPDTTGFSGGAAEELSTTIIKGCWTQGYGAASAYPAPYDFYPGPLTIHNTDDIRHRLNIGGICGGNNQFMLDAQSRSGGGLGLPFVINYSNGDIDLGSAFQTVTIGGTTFNSGDTVSLTFTNTTIGSPFPITITYTLGSNETLYTVTRGLLVGIEGNTSLSNHGVNAEASSNIIHVYQVGANSSATVLSQSVTGTGNETVSFTPSGGVLTASGTTYNPGNLVLNGGVRTAVRSSGASTVTIGSSDYFLCLDPTSNAITANLPSSPPTGMTFLIKDCTGQAATHNITVTPNSGNIDGSSTFVMSTNFQSIAVTYSGSQWSVN